MHNQQQLSNVEQNERSQTNEYAARIQNPQRSEAQKKGGREGPEMEQESDQAHNYLNRSDESSPPLRIRTNDSQARQQLSLFAQNINSQGENESKPPSLIETLSPKNFLILSSRLNRSRQESPQVKKELSTGVQDRAMLAQQIKLQASSPSSMRPVTQPSKSEKQLRRVGQESPTIQISTGEFGSALQVQQIESPDLVLQTVASEQNAMQHLEKPASQTSIRSALGPEMQENQANPAEALLNRSKSDATNKSLLSAMNLESANKSVDPPAYEDTSHAEGCQIIPIPLLKDETTDVKKGNAIEYYFDQCQRYAKQNLMQVDINIEKYMIKYQDIDDRIFDDVTNQIGISIEELQQNYENLDIKIFKDIIFINGKQQIVVKTWEKMVNKRPRSEPFFIKTLRLYDHHNELICSILTEQVKGNFDMIHLYETSFLKREQSIYYFKAIYCDLRDPDESVPGG